MVPPNITEALMARLLDKNAKDENGKEIAKYPITKEILVQYIEAKTDFGGRIPILIFTRRKRRRWFKRKQQWRKYTHSEKDSVARAAVSEEKVAVAHLFSGQCNACGEYGHESAHCPQKWACWTCGDLSHRAAQCPKLQHCPRQE